MFNRVALGLLVSTLSLSRLVVAQTSAIDAGAAVTFRLDKAGFVSVAIDDAEGKRVRNLVGAKWFEAGNQSQAWDGLDDTGQQVPAGNYHWKGLVHQALEATFEGAFNSPGDPPWLTAEVAAQRYVRASGGGGWLSDHATPDCAYSDGEHVFFGAKIAEAGHSIMELDQQGRKVWGTLWLGLSGANAIFKKNDVLYVAGEKGWMKDSLAIFRLNPETHRLLRNPPGSSIPEGEVAFIKVNSKDFADIRGMVVTDTYIVLSLGDHDRLALFAIDSGKYIRDIPLPGAGAIVPTDGDAFLAISGKTVVRLKLDNALPQTVISRSLVEPVGLAVSSTGKILVSDVAEAEQVIKVFSPAGILTKTIGAPGGRKEGSFDPQAMNAPRALAVDGKDQIWVGESDFLPKRISVWTMDGRLIDGWTGPPAYGGGGALDTENPSRAFYKGMEFSVASWPEASKLSAILFEPKVHLDLPLATNAHHGSNQGISYEGIPQAPVYRGKHLYLINDQGFGVRAVFIGEVVDNHLVPRAIFGSVKGLVAAWSECHPEYIKSLAALAPQGDGVFLWQDKNGDGKADPTEVQVQPGWRFGAMWAMRSWPTLNLYARSADGRQIMEVKPETKGDKLAYDLADATSIPLPPEIKGVTASSPDLQGNLLINTGGGGDQGNITNMYYSVARSGKINWSYPNPYPANWHNSPRPKAGDIQHTLNVEGVVSLDGGRGNIFQLNGNKGVRYLLTTDGLFVGQLYGDMRTAPTFSSVPKASYGLRMDTYSLGDECFQGWMGQTKSGTILQVVGKDSSNVMKVSGLETLQRLKGGDVRLQKTAQQALATQAVVRPITPVLIGALGKGWENTQKNQRLDSDPAAWFAIGYRADGMTLKFIAEDTRPFANAGEDPKTLFKTGNAVDFRISVVTNANPARTAPVPGDMRFIFSTWRGQPVAVRYRFVVPHTNEDAKAKFASPTGVAVVDEVSIVNDAKVKIERTAKGWELTAYLPWAALGLDQAPTESLMGDVGLIVADFEGTRTVARHYYFDRGSQVVSDLPSEVRVDPSRWGKIQF